MLHPDAKIINGPDRAGDIRNSLADITTTKNQLHYEGLVNFDEGIRELIEKVSIQHTI